MEITSVVLGEVQSVKGTKIGSSMKKLVTPIVMINDHNVKVRARGEAQNVLEITSVVLGEVQSVRGTKSWVGKTHAKNVRI